MGGKPLGKVAMATTERQPRWRAMVRRQQLLAGIRDCASLTPPRPRDAGDPDFWPTVDRGLVAALVRHVLPELPSGRVWEPAAGDDMESNWLPAPSGKFNLMLRMYWPDTVPPSLLDGSWAPPLVTPLS